MDDPLPIRHQAAEPGAGLGRQRVFEAGGELMWAGGNQNFVHEHSVGGCGVIILLCGREASD